MPRYALLTSTDGPSGIANIILADSLESARKLSKLRCIEVDATVGTHWHYDGTKFLETENN